MCALHVVRNRIDETPIEVTVVEDQTAHLPAMYHFVVGDLGNPKKLVVSRGDTPVAQFTFPTKGATEFKYQQLNHFDCEESGSILKVCDQNMEEMKDGMYPFGKDNSYAIHNWYPEGGSSVLLLRGNPEVSVHKGSPIVFWQTEADGQDFKCAYFGWCLDRGIRLIQLDNNDPLQVFEDTLGSKPNRLRQKIEMEKMALLSELAKLNPDRQQLALAVMRKSLETFQRVNE